MTIKFNHQLVDLPDNATLLDFLVAVNLHEATGLAVAVHQKVISKTNWSSHVLNHHDDIMVIKATQGG
jgi:sulfur carrier protein